MDDQLMFDKGAKNINGERIVSLIKMVLGKQEIHMQKNEIRLLSYTTYKN